MFTARCCGRRLLRRTALELIRSVAVLSRGYCREFLRSAGAAGVASSHAARRRRAGRRGLGDRFRRPRAGPDRRAARLPSGYGRQRQRHGADVARDPALAGGAVGALALHRPWRAAAERVRGELQRTVQGRVPERAPVQQPGRGTPDHFGAGILAADQDRVLGPRRGLADGEAAEAGIEGVRHKLRIGLKPEIDDCPLRFGVPEKFPVTECWDAR